MRTCPHTSTFLEAILACLASLSLNREDSKTVLHLSFNSTGIFLISLYISNTMPRNAQGMVHISLTSALTQSLCHSAKQIPPHSCNATALGLYWRHRHTSMVKILEDRHRNIPLSPPKEKNIIESLQETHFYSNIMKSFPSFCLCLSLLTKVLSLHLKCLMNPLGFYLTSLLLLHCRVSHRLTDVI